MSRPSELDRQLFSQWMNDHKNQDFSPETLAEVRRDKEEPLQSSQEQDIQTFEDELDSLESQLLILTEMVKEKSKEFNAENREHQRRLILADAAVHVNEIKKIENEKANVIKHLNALRKNITS